MTEELQASLLHTSQHIKTAILTLLAGQCEVGISMPPGEFHIRFPHLGRWFKLTEDHEGSWIILPCDANGGTVERIGRPAEMTEAMHPDCSPGQVATFAIMTAARWQTPELLNSPQYLKANCGKLYH